MVERILTVFFPVKYMHENTDAFSMAYQRRLWRLKDSSLHSAPLPLEDFWNAEFFDIDFNAGVSRNQLPE